MISSRLAGLMKSSHPNDYIAGLLSPANSDDLPVLEAYCRAAMSSHLKTEVVSLPAHQARYRELQFSTTIASPARTSLMKSITFPILLPFTTCSYKTLIFLDVPNGQPSVLADSKDLADRTVVLPLVSVDMGDRVLMNSLQLARSGLSRSSAQTASTAPRGRGR